MKIKNCLLLIVVCGTYMTNKSFAQNFDTTDARNIKWQSRSLVADDYRHSDSVTIPSDMASFDAWTSAHVTYRYKKVGAQLHFLIQNYFFYDKSWMKPGMKKRKDLLAHEQGHFDLTEIMGRRFGKALQSYSFTENYKHEIPLVFNVVLDSYRQVQATYDEQTKHGADRIVQKMWQDKITDELGSLPVVNANELVVDLH